MAKQTINIGTTANDGTGDTLRAAFDKCNDNFTELYTDDAGDVGSITATAPISRDQATGAVTISLNDDGITHAKLAPRYTATSAVTSATTITIDTETADVFTWTAGHSTTVSFTNAKIGDTCSLIITGGGSSYTLALGNINGSSGTFNRLAGTYSDTSAAKNLIEFKFISTSEAWYQISQIAT